MFLRWAKRDTKGSAAKSKRGKGVGARKRFSGGNAKRTGAIASESRIIL